MTRHGPPTYLAVSQQSARTRLSEELIGCALYHPCRTQDFTCPAVVGFVFGTGHGIWDTDMDVDVDTGRARRNPQSLLSPCVYVCSIRSPRGKKFVLPVDAGSRTRKLFHPVQLAFSFLSPLLPLPSSKRAPSLLFLWWNSPGAGVPPI